MIEKSSTQRDRILTMLRTKYPAYHPLMSLAEIAHTTEDERLSADCHKTIAKYVEPELKSTELKMDDDGQAGILRLVLSTGADGPSSA